MFDVIREPQVRHFRSSPVFVIGSARSGTSLTCSLLRKFLKISFGTESQFIIRYLRRLGGYGDLREDRNVRQLIADIGRERFFARTRQNFGFVLDPDRAFLDLRERTYRGILVSIFEQFARDQRMARWGDKTPEYNEDLLALWQLFPRAQFIHVVRDGRDVALSMFSMHFGPKNAYEAAQAWMRTLEQIRQFKEMVPRAQFLEVRYEDLIGAPARTLSEIAAFVEVDDCDGALARFIERHVAGDVRSANSGKWKRGFSPGDAAIFDAIARDGLAAYGYEIQHGPRRKVGPLSGMYWRAHGGCTRLSMQSYWADNWYKLGLRARGLPLPHSLTSPLAAGGVTIRRTSEGGFDGCQMELAARAPNGAVRRRGRSRVLRHPSDG